MYRHNIYPGADSTENLLELNEGIAEYTGIVMSGRTKEQVRTHFFKSVDNFLKNATFVRSFAYQTVPMYGYLLSDMNQEWNKKVDSTTNLTEYFLRQFDILPPSDLKTPVAQISDRYGGRTISAKENARGTRSKKIMS